MALQESTTIVNEMLYANDTLCFHFARTIKKKTLIMAALVFHFLMMIIKYEGQAKSSLDVTMKWKDKDIQFGEAISVLRPVPSNRKDKRFTRRLNTLIGLVHLRMKVMNILSMILHVLLVLLPWKTLRCWLPQLHISVSFQEIRKVTVRKTSHLCSSTSSMMPGTNMKVKSWYQTHRMEENTRIWNYSVDTLSHPQVIQLINRMQSI